MGAVRKKKKEWEESRRSRAFAKTARDSLERADRATCHRPTRTRTPSPPRRRTGLPLATWTPGRPRVQGRAALLQTADRPEGDGRSHSRRSREPRPEGETG